MFTNSPLEVSIIDLATASDMQLAEISISSSHLIDGVPSIHSLFQYPTFDASKKVEMAFTHMIQQSLGIEIDPLCVSTFSAGTYGAYSQIVVALGIHRVYLPDRIHETHKEAFRRHVREVTELKTDINGQILQSELDTIDDLPTHLLLLSSCRGKRLNALTLEQKRTFSKLVILIDTETIITVHDGGRSPLFAATTDQVSPNTITLYSLTKEFWLPSLRTSFAVCSTQLLKKTIDRHLRESLLIPSQYLLHLAEWVLAKWSLKNAGIELKSRMEILTNGLSRTQMLYLLPDIGINLFLQVPLAFTQITGIRGDELFIFYLKNVLGIYARPGKDFWELTLENSIIRLCISKNISLLQETVHRLTQTVHINMLLPKNIITQFIQYNIACKHSEL
jgi:Aminotransferase class I and II